MMLIVLFFRLCRIQKQHLAPARKVCSQIRNQLPPAQVNPDLMHPNLMLISLLSGWSQIGRQSIHFLNCDVQRAHTNNQNDSEVSQSLYCGN